MESKQMQTIFPWYKERLQTKYLGAPSDKISSVSSCWSFVDVSDGDMSDYSSVLSVAQGGVSPVIFRGNPGHGSARKPAKITSKEHACFSKQMIRKQIRREYVATTEQKLKQHPFAMYPYYKDHLTPELFEKVVSVLDPDVCSKSASSPPAPAADHAEEKEERKSAEPRDGDTKRAEQVSSANPINPGVRSPSVRNPYILRMNGNGFQKEHGGVNQRNNHGDMKAPAKLFRKWFVSPA